jgi:hypothetical protein
MEVNAFDDITGIAVSDQLSARPCPALPHGATTDTADG